MKIIRFNIMDRNPNIKKLYPNVLKGFKNNLKNERLLILKKLTKNFKCKKYKHLKGVLQ